MALTKPSPGILGSPVLVATSNTTSGTTVDITGIPAGVKVIRVTGVGVSENGSYALCLQLGDSGGIETTGYTGGAVRVISNSSYLALAETTKFMLTVSSNAANTQVFGYTLMLHDASTNTWVISGNAFDATAETFHSCSGSKALTGTLDRIRLLSTGTFDAGKLSIQYE